MNVSYPFTIDKLGKSTLAVEEKHIRDMIEQVLFTAPGERVMRPDFGSGVYQLVFAPIHESLSSTVQQTIHASLQKWLSNSITVENVIVETNDSTISIEVSYRILSSGENTVATFERSI